jgi:hypothetical protein
MAVEMNCSSGCRFTVWSDVKWEFLNASGNTGKARPVPVNGDSNYALTSSGGLVIFRVAATEHMGTYRCTFNGIVLAEHTLSASGYNFFRYGPVYNACFAPCGKFLTFLGLTVWDKYAIGNNGDDIGADENSVR